MPAVPTDTHGDRNTGALRPHPEPSQPPEALDEPLGRLRAADDPDQIAAAVRDALATLPTVLASPDWLDDALDHARNTAAEIRRDPDPGRRAESWLHHGPQTLRYVAGVSIFARGLL